MTKTLQCEKTKAGEETVYVAAIGDRAFFRLFSDTEIASEGLETIEAQLQAEFDWFERLGRIPVNDDPDVGKTYNLEALEELLPWSSRKLVKIDDLNEILYRIESWGSPN